MIYEATAVSFSLDAGCPPGSERRAVAELKAYDFRDRFFDDGGLPVLHVYRENMTFAPVRDGLSFTRENDGRTATLRFSTCGSVRDSLRLGFAFVDGNGVCVEWR